MSSIIKTSKLRKLSKNEEERAIKHIKNCDQLFDGNVVTPDKEFAYQQMRVLALELLEHCRGL